MPYFSIITPNLNMLSSLRHTCSSIRDQGESHEHIIVDPGSTDGSREWITAQELDYIFEPDEGMYDAINKGLSRSSGEVVAYLNSDEQYLPETLKFVREFFETNPDVDVLFGDVIITNPDGSIKALRKGYKPISTFIAISHLYVFSCTMFLRRRVLDQGMKFNTDFKDLGDAEFVIRLLKNNFVCKHINFLSSTFCYSGNNMSLGENARRESSGLKNSQPPYVRYLSFLINGSRLLFKLASGGYSQPKFIEYSIYTDEMPGKRHRFGYENPNWRWPKVDG
jgi:glycosyltransferase involved in cell wall biosynthesis